MCLSTIRHNIAALGLTGRYTVLVQCGEILSLDYLLFVLYIFILHEKTYFHPQLFYKFG